MRFDFLNFDTISGKLHLPAHMVPGPSNPDLHSQLNPPSVLMQLALSSQLSVSSVHSLTSARRS